MTLTDSAKRIKHGLGILAIALSCQSAFAAGDWQINPAGSGTASATTVSSVNVGGVGFVQTLPDSSGTGAYTFIENGAYQVLDTNGTGPFGASDLTVTYSVTGTGSAINPGALHMTGGSINLYADTTFDFGTSAGIYGANNGKLVASFQITNGYVADSTGLVTVIATGVSGSFAQGYLFNAAGSDMANLPNVLLQLNIRNKVSTPDSMVVSEIVCEMAAACANGFMPSPYGFTVQDSATVSISAVPEPETVGMLLAGLALIGAVARRRSST